MISSDTMKRAVETVLFHGIAYLHDARDETWLRETLRHLTFYLTESGVLLVGGLSAAVFTASPWFLALLLPVFVLAQRAALHEPLRQRAEHDDKTDLLRYEAWERQARTAAARCTRHGKPWSVLFVDLDHFKQFNDVWGHLAGDHAIEATARVIGDEVRSGDLVARFGGEEFCVFLPATGPDDGLALAERIRAALASTDLPGAQQLTASVGLASRQPCGGTLAFAGADADALDLADVVRSADRALYAAKESGRNTTRVRLVS